MDSLEQCKEKRDLIKLVGREAEFITKDVKPKNLVGLRRRITAGFLRIIRTPEFNPEIARFEKVSRIDRNRLFNCVNG